MFVRIDTGDGPMVVHLQTVKPARVVPGPERHKWSRKPERGQTARCTKCGCVKCYRISYETVYRQKGSSTILTELPACTGKPSPHETQPPHENPAHDASASPPSRPV